MVALLDKGSSWAAGGEMARERAPDLKGKAQSKGRARKEHLSRAAGAGNGEGRRRNEAWQKAATRVWRCWLVMRRQKKRASFRPRHQRKPSRARSARRLGEGGWRGRDFCFADPGTPCLSGSESRLPAWNAWVCAGNTIMSPCSSPGSYGAVYVYLRPRLHSLN